MAETNQKNIIYLEHDAEITEAIEQLKAAEGDKVRLVVPGRSGLLQSVVNLKLLKKAAQSGDKELILVTSDKTATALAGKLELAVAKNINAAPHIEAGEPEPDRTTKISADEESPNEDSGGLAAVPVQRYDAPNKKASRSKADKPAKGAKVPNYQKFQLWIWIGAGAFILFLFLWLATAFLQTATIHVQASADQRPVDTTFVLSTTKSGATTLTAQSLELVKDLSQTYQASGQKDVGAKASGTVSVKNCEDTDSHPLPAGSKLVTGGKAFLTTGDATIPEGDFAGGGSVCKSKSVSVAVAAEANGDSYNFSGATFSVTGLTAKVSGTGTTSGGVTKNVTVVAQGDIDGAQKTAIEGAKTQALSDLRDMATDDQKVFDDTITSSVVSATPNPPAGAEAGSGTLTLKVKYTVLTAQVTDMEALVKASLGSQIPAGGELLDAGLDQAELKQTKASGGDFTYQLKTTAFTGQPIDKDALAKQAAGRSKKEVSDIAKQYPNVSGVTIDSWVFVPNMPANASNIKVDIKVSK